MLTDARQYANPYLTFANIYQHYDSNKVLIANHEITIH